MNYLGNSAIFTLSGRGAARLACLTRVQEVGGSNPLAPTSLWADTSQMIYYLSKYIALFLLYTFFRFRVRGREFVPRNGPCFIVSNHSSYLDPIVVGCASPRRVYFVAKEELFSNPVARFFLKQLGAFPLRRGEADREAVKTILALLRKNKAVCLFPEGTRNQGTVQELRSGAVKLLMKSKVPIVVAGLRGTYESYPQGSKRIHIHPISVSFSVPLEELPQNLEESKMTLMEKMEALSSAL